MLPEVGGILHMKLDYIKLVKERNNNLTSALDIFLWDTIDYCLFPRSVTVADWLIVLWPCESACKCGIVGSAIVCSSS